MFYGLLSLCSNPKNALQKSKIIYVQTSSPNLDYNKLEIYEIKSHFQHDETQSKTEHLYVLYVFDVKIE